MGAVSDACAGVRISLGVYLLGALEPGERALTEAHLADCPACREELVQLAGLPGLLGRLSLADVAEIGGRPELAGADAGGNVAAFVRPGAGSPGSPGSLARALTEIHRGRQTTRRRLVAAAAAVALVAAGVSAGVTVAATGTDGRPPGRKLTASDAATRVGANVWVADDPAGSVFTVRLWGVPPGSHCVLVAQAVDGHQETAASWEANYHGYVSVRGTSGIAVGQLARLLVVDDNGRELVVLPARTT